LPTYVLKTLVFRRLTPKRLAMSSFFSHSITSFLFCLAFTITDTEFRLCEHRLTAKNARL